jgi:hypothetical protein
MQRFMLAKVTDGKFELFTQRGLVVMIDDLKTAKMAVQEEAEDHDNHLEIRRLVVAEKSQNPGWFTAIDSKGELMMNAGRLVVSRAYSDIEMLVDVIPNLFVGEFVEVK